ncbi:MAG: hypothetical protein BGO59_22905 [Spirosoma sp. 48-14]|nr:MAG: hypothetical protein BGO59_22905 [Spirosoma sp. 48-14]
MIKTLLLTPFIVALGILFLCWFAVAICSIVVLAFVLSPVFYLLDQSFNAFASMERPSKYAHYDQ